MLPREASDSMYHIAYNNNHGCGFHVGSLVCFPLQQKEDRKKQKKMFDLSKICEDACNVGPSPVLLLHAVPLFAVLLLGINQRNGATITAMLGLLYCVYMAGRIAKPKPHGEEPPKVPESLPIENYEEEPDMADVSADANIRLYTTAKQQTQRNRIMPNVRYHRSTTSNNTRFAY